jgi:hypothetical protein
MTNMRQVFVSAVFAFVVSTSVGRSAQTPDISYPDVDITMFEKQATPKAKEAIKDPRYNHNSARLVDWIEMYEGLYALQASSNVYCRVMAGNDMAAKKTARIHLESHAHSYAGYLGVMKNWDVKSLPADFYIPVPDGSLATFDATQLKVPMTMLIDKYASCSNRRH